MGEGWKRALQAARATQRKDKLPAASPEPEKQKREICEHTGDPHYYGLHNESGEWQCSFCGKLRPIPVASPETTKEDAGAELKPCPFCGKQPASRWLSAGLSEDDGYWGIDCCNACSHADCEEDAVAAWNRRTQPAIGEDGELPPLDSYRYKTSEEAKQLPLSVQLLRLEQINSELCKSHNTLLIDAANQQRRAEAAEAKLSALGDGQPAPTVTMQMLIDCGLNGFAFELVSESLAGKGMAERHGFKPLRFEFRGVIYTLEAAPPVAQKETL